MAEPVAPLRLTWIRLALREVVNNRKFSLLFTLNLAIGMVGFVTVDAFKESVGSELASRSKSILGADLAVSANRPLTDAEVGAVSELLPEGSVVAREVAFFSMVRYEAGTRLVEVRAVDPSFPLYGEIQLGQAGLVKAGAGHPLTGTTDTWVYPELLSQLGAELGAELHVGDLTLRATDTVLNDPTTSAVSFSIAPRIYLDLARLGETGLLGKGSRTFHSVLVRLPAGTGLQLLTDRLETAFKATPEVKVRSHTQATEDLGRLTIYLNDYLGLIAIVALFFANIGSVFLFRSFISTRSREIAILMCLGASPKEARVVYIVQLLFLGLCGAAVTTGLAFAVTSLLPDILAPFLGRGINIRLPLQSVAFSVGAGVLGSLCFCLPILGRFRTLNPSELFREGGNPQIEAQAVSWLAYAAGLIAYWGLAVVQTRSLKVGSVFTGGFVAALLASLFCGFLVIKVILPRWRPRSWVRRLAVRTLVRDSAGSLSCFLALSLAALLVNLVPQIRTIVAQELSSPDSALPSLFLFDIQDDQLPELERFLKETGGISLLNPSPLVRARLTEINKVPVSETGTESMPGTREQEREEQFRSRLYNLSFRERLTESEILVDGVPITGTYDWSAGGPAQISLEVRFAERLGLKLGDIMTFDIQGLSVSGVVVNLRQVRWTSFQPNFFVQFQPGVLEDAPKTWVSALPALAAADRSRFQGEIVKRFSNISIIDVSSTVRRILDLVGRMAQAVSTMAALALIAGLCVLYAIVNHQTMRRRREVALLKSLGASYPEIMAVAVFELTILGGAAIVAGGIGCVALNFAIAKVVFNSPGGVDALPLLLGLLAVLLTALCTGGAAIYGALRSKPVELLGGRT